jgi:thiamine biosynthesis protein ThiI
MIIVRHGEIYTKSEPVRRIFTRKLANNIQEALPKSKITLKRWRILVEGGKPEVLKRIFGIVSFSPAEECSASLNDIKKLVEKKFLKGFGGKTFAVRTQKIDSKLSSTKINIEIGDLIRTKAKAKVNLDNPQRTLYIEIDKNKAYVFTDIIDGPGGLPLGTADGMVKILGKKENDVLAAWMIMKRGASLIRVPTKLKKWAYGNSKGELLAAVSGVTEPKDFIKIQSKEKLPVFAPLMGLNKKEISKLRKKVL